MYKKIEECCKYQERIKKLTKTRKRKKKSAEIDDECENGGNGSARGTVRKKLASVRGRYVAEIDRGIERIKPPVHVRDEYSFSRHIQCVMDNSTKDSRLSGNFYGHSAADNAQKRKTRKKPSNKMKAARMQDPRATPGVRGFESENVKSVKFRGKGRTQLPDTESSTPSEASSECDEICSFDSDINLSGVTLTAEDRATVADNYTKAQANPTNTENVDKSGVAETA